MSYDPLSISNAMLDLASRRGIFMRPHDLQRSVYFAHGLHLTKTGCPLVNGCFEAWRYGPVHPIIYLAFASAENAAIDFRATRRHPGTYLREAPPPVEDWRVIDLLARVISPDFGGSPMVLAALVRAENAPWHHVVSQVVQRKSVHFRISNSCIKERFAFHKTNADSIEEEGLEDMPFSFEDFAEIIVPNSI